MTNLLFPLLTLALCASVAFAKCKHDMRQIDLTDLSAYWSGPESLPPAIVAFPAVLENVFDYTHHTPLIGHNLTIEEGVAYTTKLQGGRRVQVPLRYAIGFSDDGRAYPNYTNTSNPALAKSYLEMPAGQIFNITFFVKLKSLTGGKKWFVAKEKNAGGAKLEYSVSWSATTERFEFSFGSGGLNADVVSADAFYTALGAPQLDTWYFINAFRSANAIRIYVKPPDALGYSDSLVTTELGGLGSPSPDFRLGQTSDGAGAGGFWLDNVAILKRAFVWGEMEFLYNNHQGRSWEEIMKEAGPSCKKITCCN